MSKAPLKPYPGAPGSSAATDPVSRGGNAASATRVARSMKQVTSWKRPGPSEAREAVDGVMRQPEERQAAPPHADAPGCQSRMPLAPPQQPVQHVRHRGAAIAKCLQPQATTAGSAAQEPAAPEPAYDACVPMTAEAGKLALSPQVMKQRTSDGKIRGDTRPGKRSRPADPIQLAEDAATATGATPAEAATVHAPRATAQQGGGHTQMMPAHQGGDFAASSAPGALEGRWEPKADIDPITLERRIELGGRYIEKNCKATGWFMPDNDFFRTLDALGRAEGLQTQDCGHHTPQVVDQRRDMAPGKGETTTVQGWREKIRKRLVPAAHRFEGIQMSKHNYSLMVEHLDHAQEQVKLLKEEKERNDEEHIQLRAAHEALRETHWMQGILHSELKTFFASQSNAMRSLLEEKEQLRLELEKARAGQSRD